MWFTPESRRAMRRELWTRDLSAPT